jgi:VCBS repeat-containing protein
LKKNLNCSLHAEGLWKYEVQNLREEIQTLENQKNNLWDLVVFTEMKKTFKTKMKPKVQKGTIWW